MKNFLEYSKFYDLLYKDKDYKAECKYVHEILIENGITSGEILEFGSGTGRHACMLADLGYRVHGVELSSDMVAIAHRAQGFTCEQGDISKVDLNKKFNAVLSLFHVISYQVSNEKIKSVFFNAAKHLDSGGLFVFDFWYSPAVYTHRPEVRLKKIVDEKNEITRIAEPNIFNQENRVDVNYTIFAKNKDEEEYHILKETHPMRHFSLPEIKLIAELTGFSFVLAEEFLTKKVPSENTWGVCVILKKK